MTGSVQPRRVVANGFESTAAGELPSSLSDSTGVTVETASDDALIERLESDGVSALLLADEPPARDGLAQFQRVRANGLMLPVILVGSEVDPDRIETALSAGVTDYVAGWNAERTGDLAARLRAYARQPSLDGAVQADRWNEAVGSFAHDAKNPLNVVTGRLELLDIDETHASAIKRSVRRVESLINELSTTASIIGTAGDLEAVSLADAAERAWGGDPDALTVATERTVDADPDGLAELLGRLFENARHHGGEGVSVTVGDTEAGFYVADDGPGIPPSERDRVFEQGYGTARDGEGYGLFVADSVARAYGWILTAGESDDGGARMDVTCR